MNRKHKTLNSKRQTLNNGLSSDLKLQNMITNNVHFHTALFTDLKGRDISARGFAPGIEHSLNIFALKGRYIAGLLLGMLVFITGCDDKKDDVKEEKKVPVVAKPYVMTQFSEEVRVSGTVEAKSFALVSARIPGTLDTVDVDEGDQVVENKTQLFSTDALKLQKAKEIAVQELAVAKCSVEERMANLERVQADFDKVELDFKRYKRLYETSKAVTIDVFEQHQSRMAQAKAGLKYATVLVKLSETQQGQAASNLAIAEKDLEDAVVFAPISGIVIERLMEPGEMAAPGTPLIRIEDLSILKVSAFLPGEFYPRVIPGQTKLRLVVNGVDLGMQTVSFKSSGLDKELRTFKVKCELTNPPAGVVPGGMASVAVILKQRQSAGIAMEAVINRGGKDVVFVVENGVAKQVEVEMGLKQEGLVELVDCDLSATAEIITMGQTMIEPGAVVELVEEGK